MEAFASYLLKSVIWIAGFALVFILFLRNERFFFLNRIYLIAGILTSFFFPLFSIHYTVVLPVIGNFQSDSAVVTGVQKAGNSIIPDLKLILAVLYVSGVLLVLTYIIKQARTVFRAIKKSEIISLSQVKLIKTADYTSAFSFFSYVFVNPSITDVETKEIMIHELVHIRQKHWLDLLLVEMLCMMQWFNPIVWIYVRFIRQNHEYLADEVALQRTSDPAIYRAVLLNQIVGSPVVSLTNSFNYSLSKKRFNMMKKIISSPYRKMKILLILPVFAIVLYAFAKPEYRYKNVDESSGNNGQLFSSQTKTVKGIVQHQNGESLTGAIVVIQGTTIGTVTDAKGQFKLENVPDDGQLVVSFVGFKSRVLKPVFNSEMTINMTRDTIKYNGPPPLVVIDGTITDIEVDKIDPETIYSMSVLKDKSATEKSATDKYGEKGKNGVIEVTIKKNAPTPDKDVPAEKAKEATTVVKEIPAASGTGKDAFVVVEEMPEFPGGRVAMQAWIAANLKYPAEAAKNKITGKVYVSFIVSSTGKVKNVVVSKSASPLLNAEAIRVISSMPDWKPASQAGKPVEVQIMVPVEFKLK
jgi:TonB family protein